jgi:hypothetical protein
MEMEKFLPPQECKQRKIFPRRVNGDGNGEAFLILIFRGDPLNLYVTMFSYNN